MNVEYDVTGNVKAIEWIKTELLGAVTTLHRVLLKGTKASQDMILECLASIIILTYLLSRRLGIDFSSVDSEIKAKLKLGIVEGDDIEKDHGDLSKLLKYIGQRK
ncbi:MAG TPA: hypothetical protein DD429_12085 [Clostridiaceae bacterium]|jgi:hypothetical protein|nr:hypothetical protein [Clostridiaceae bacterium]